MSPLARKRIAMGLAALLGTFMAAIILTPLLMPSAQVRAAFIEEAQRRTGLEVKVEGEVLAAALPWPHVSLQRVRIGQSGAGAFVSADEVIGSLRLLPLLKGEFIFSGYRLNRATLRLPMAGQAAQANWDDVLDTGKRMADDKVAGIALPAVEIADGTIELVDEDGRIHFDVSELALEASWPGMGHGASVAGRCRLMGEMVDFRAVLANPSAIALGKRTGLALNVKSQLLSGRFDGALTAGHQSVAEGELSLEAASLRSALNWLQQRRPGAREANDAFSVRGQAVIANGIVSLANAQAILEGNAANGALSAKEHNGRLSVNGTLDAQKIDVSPYLSDYSPAMAGDSGGWNRKPIDFGVLSSTDIDVRLSAHQLIIGSVSVQEAAAIAVARDGRMTVTLGEAKSHGGTVKGGLIITSVKDNPSFADVNGDLALQDVELGQGLAEWFGLKRLQGKGSIRLALNARGASVQELMRSLGGRGKLAATNGQVTGIDVEAILTRLERKPLSAATGIDTRSGQTPYQSLNSDVLITGGVATTQNLVLDSPKVRVAMAGSLTVPTREVDMKGLAMLKSDKETPFELPFMVRGTWDDPFFLPDGDNLIRRSNAANPLRDITRDRDRLRAVEDAIKRSGMTTDEQGRSGLPISINPFQALPPR